MSSVRENALVAKPSGWGARHTLAILGFLGLALAYALRFNLSIAIVAMVRTKVHNSSSASFQNETEETCSELKQDALQSHGSKPSYEGEFDWSSTEQVIRSKRGFAALIRGARVDLIELNIFYAESIKRMGSVWAK